MGLSAFRKTVSCVLVMGFPTSILAADARAAMVHSYGAAWLNGSYLPASSAIFSGDLLQTRLDSAANISSPGSSIVVLGDSVVQFQGTSLKLEHGGVAVATSKSVAASVGEVRVVPASNSWTEFNVVDTDGTVRIAARKGDLTITDGAGTSTLAQGQETTRDEQSNSSSKDTDRDTDKDKKKRKRGAAAPQPAWGAILDSKVAIGLDAAAITGVTVWVLTRSDDPVSPSAP
jgi:hypothetical protein